MTTVITPDDVQTYADPELENCTEEQLQRAIDLAGALISERAWGTTYKVGMLALASHFAYYATVVGENSGSGGMVIEEREGDVSRRYSERTAGGDFNTTGFGEQYLMLKATIPASPMIV